MTISALITRLQQCPEPTAPVQLRYVFRQGDGLSWIEFEIADVHEDGGVVVIEGEVV
jgi:hypothetical protein